ncbi:hypothetical protein [Nocardiopsis nanhaiensis]
MDSSERDAARKALDALRRYYGDTYTIHRNGILWVATHRDPNPDTAPTVIEESLERFIASLEFPTQRFARPTDKSAAHP